MWRLRPATCTARRRSLGVSELLERWFTAFALLPPLNLTQPALRNAAMC